MTDGAIQTTDEGSLSDLKRLWPWLRPYRGYLIFMLVIATLAMVVQSILPLVTAALIDGPIARHDVGGMYPLIGLALLFGLAEAVLFGIRRRAMTTSALAIETDLRRDFYQHLQRLPVRFHDRWPSGQLLSRVTSDLSTLRRFVGFIAVFFFANLAVIVVILVLLIKLDPPLGLAVCVVMLPLGAATRYYEHRYNLEARRAQDLTGDLATSVEESVLGIRVIKSFGRRRQLLDDFTEDAGRLRAAELQKNRTLANLWTVIGTYPQLVLAGVTLFGVIAVAHGRLSTGELVAFITLQLRLNWPLMALGWLIAGTEEAVAATARIFEVMDSSTDLTEPDRPASLPHTDRPARLSFDDVSFRFPGAESDALSHVQLDIHAGETMALVGPTGSGKTILTALVPRLHDVSSGAIRIDGVAIDQITLDELRSTVSTAFEEPTLFSASVRENITLGRPDATDAEVTEAVDIAQAGFVHELPYGLDTRVGEQGLSLSGGQRQRLALARAVLGRPRVLVLDDPLSALDVHTEALVEKALRRVLADTTALVVAHRASTVLLADRVALLEDGAITAVGTHSELMAGNERYRNLLSQKAEVSA
ncbi:ABC transporter ATP-binding protein/permease [Jatrophihabitans telluris]|uniref:ABC transporter ATP-binding protein/permease n=1 Tax=Jatrophihabitans telluris TaxID=2038343 RepID=A0ABY4QZX7_9ACTN|nr:ABC transporter ATP-binding protein [Jatrophihabitans telluris]UQX89134.1 ABC transporter ATP-binding protein/permease [Jatrophihabitans telluris]